MAFLGSIGSGGLKVGSGGPVVGNGLSDLQYAMVTVSVGALPTLVTDQGLAAGIASPFSIPTGAVAGSLSVPDTVIGTLG